MTVSRYGTSIPAFRASSFLACRADRASAMRIPAWGPSPLLLRIRCRRGTWEERNATRGAWVLRPNALSFKLIVCNFGSVKSAVSRDERAWGISLRRRPVNMSARLAICKNVSLDKQNGPYVKYSPAVSFLSPEPLQWLYKPQLPKCFPATGLLQHPPLLLKAWYEVRHPPQYRA